MKRSIVFFVALFLMSAFHIANAQDEAFCTAKAPSEVGVNQQFQYTVTT